MRQYLDAKRQYRDALLFFRMGDFYEMFYEDAVTAARALELTLTSRSKDSGGSPIPMCGVPYHAGDTYIARLVKRGFRVAICDQVENPKNAKGVVKREVTRERLAAHFADICKGPVELYPLDNLLAIKIVLNAALQGGAARSLRMDNLGKSVAAQLLRMEIEAPADLPRLARA